MSVVVIEVGKNGKIELTKEELERMLNRAYEEGRSSAMSSHWWYTTSPSVTYTNEAVANGVQISSDKITI